MFLVTDRHTLAFFLFHRMPSKENSFDGVSRDDGTFADSHGFKETQFDFNPFYDWLRAVDAFDRDVLISAFGEVADNLSAHGGGDGLKRAENSSAWRPNFDQTTARAR